VRKDPGTRGQNIRISRAGIVDFSTSLFKKEIYLLGRLQSCRLTTTQTEKENIKKEAQLA
jgi:hypothetical protein